MKKLINIPVITAFLLISWISLSNANEDSRVVSSSQPSTSQNKTDGAIALSQTCTNNSFGYQVHYPEGWQTNPGEVVDRCRVFDPRSARVPEYTESTGKAIYLRVEKNVLFGEIAKEDSSEQHLSNKATTVADNKAVVIEGESTGKALLRPGIRKYSYIVDLGEGTLIATTYEIPGNNYQENKQILDRMMETIEIPRSLY